MRSKHTTPTIIKRSSRKAHNAVHGGAWKVAFADFTLAMMALFMVLWIMGSVTQKEREEIVMLLNNQSIFDGYSLQAIAQKYGKQGQIAVIKQKMPPSQAKSPPSHEAQQVAPLNETGEGVDTIAQRSQREIEDLARIIMHITSAYQAQSNLAMEIVPQGLRILIADDKNREMFHRSSAVLTPFFRQLLTEFAPALNKIDNKIVITGHTDNSQYHEEHYNNWNLSGERAMQARQVLAKGGLDPNKILQVSGMADQMLLDPAHPLSASNRRIEIMVLTHAASESLYNFFGQHGEKVLMPLKDNIAQ